MRVQMWHSYIINNIDKHASCTNQWVDTFPCHDNRLPWFVYWCFSLPHFLGVILTTSAVEHWFIFFKNGAFTICPMSHGNKIAIPWLDLTWLNHEKHFFWKLAFKWIVRWLNDHWLFLNYILHKLIIALEISFQVTYHLWMLHVTKYSWSLSHVFSCSRT